MKKSVKISILIASILSAVGLVVSTVGLFLMGFDFSKLNTMPTQTNTHVVTEEFRSISIQTNTADVVFVFSEEEECKVVCQEPEGLTHSVSVEEGLLEGTLVIKVQDTRKWYDHLGISFGEIKVTVYLPYSLFLGDLSIETNTGDVEIPDFFTVRSVDIVTDTGDVSVGNVNVAGNVSIATDTGDVSLNAVGAFGALRVKTNTGDLDCYGGSAASVVAQTNTGKTELQYLTTEGSMFVSANTGNVLLRNTKVGSKLTVVTNTGGVTFDRSDAALISVTTDTGDVTGSLLSEKIFFANSKTGKIQTPKGMSGGECEITTDTGDIILTIAD